MKMKRFNTNQFFIVITTLLILLPLIGFFADWDFNKTDEHRVLAPKPEFSYQKRTLLAKQSEEYFRDHFGFRQTLLKANSWINYSIFHPDIYEKVIQGKEGQLFFRAEKGLADYRHRNTLTESEITAWKEDLLAVDLLAEKSGFDFILMVAPNSQTIYPELMPDWILKLPNPSRLDQLIEIVQGSNYRHIKLLDIRKQLLESKVNQRIYLRYNTHWNDRGAAVGVNALLKVIQENKSISPSCKATLFFDPKDFVETAKPVDGDLARMIGVSDRLTEDNPEISIKGKAWPYHFVEKNHDEANYSTRNETSCVNGLKTLIFRDSFMERMQPLLSSALGEVHYLLRRSMPLKMIESEKPSIVVWEVVERHLNFYRPTLTQDSP